MDINIKMSSEFLKLFDLDQLFEMKKRCDTKYHDEGVQIISDDEYDIIVSILEMSKYSKNIVDVPAKPGKVKLPVPMWSLNKVREYKKEKIDCVVMDKLDGVSCLFYNGKAYTRGDGITGTDITSMFNKIYNINGYAIRGELVIKKCNWDEKFSNTRTMVCSFVNSLQKNSLIEFKAYELIKLGDNEIDDNIEDQMVILEKNNIPTVWNKTFKSIDDNILKDILLNRRTNSEFDIDGIVVNNINETRDSKNLSRNPRYSFAYKQNFGGILTKVIDINWDLGKTGVYTPVVCIEPVNLFGSTVKKVSGHNIKYLKDNGIGIGSEIFVTKSGQVIPSIVGVSTKSENINKPKDCDETGKIVSNIENVIDDRIHIKKLIFFAKTLQISGIGPAKAKEFISNGIFIDDFISKSERFLQFLNSSSNKNKTPSKVNMNILNSCNKVLSNNTDENILVATGCFGDRVGISKVKKLEYINDPKAKEILELWKKNWNLVVNKPDSDIISESVKEDKGVEDKGVEDKGVEDKGVVLLSGTRDKNIVKSIEDKGYKVTFTMNKKVTNVVVVGLDYNNLSKKVQDAISKQLPILDYSEF